MNLHTTLQRYKQTSEKYQACLNIFPSECSISYLKIQTNEREISSLLEYFSQRVLSFLFKDSKM